MDSPTTARIVPHLSPSKPPPLKAVADRNVRYVVLGDFLFKAWYPSYYPEELVGKEVDKLYVCQWCFKYTKDIIPFLGHVESCSAMCKPPGTLIYTRAEHAIYEIDGEADQLFAQNLSLFAKLFLDNKSVFFDVVGFKYYLLIHKPRSTAKPSAPQKHEIVGFFSKEKMSWDNNNLACILVFPPWQRQGLGKILMGASYELSKREGRLGGPEKPLSELGKRSYMKFWQVTVARAILGTKAKTISSVDEVARQCWSLPEDVLAALKSMNIVENRKRPDGGLTVSKARLRDWVVANKVDLTPSISVDGFIDEAIPHVNQLKD